MRKLNVIVLFSITLLEVLIGTGKVYSQFVDIKSIDKNIEISETRFEDSCVVVDFTNDEFIICISNTIAIYDRGINEITENLLLMLNEVDKTRLQKSQAMWDSLSLEYNQIYVGMIYEGKYLGGRESELSYYVLLKEMRKSQYNTLKILYYSVIRSR